MTRSRMMTTTTHRFERPSARLTTRIVARRLTIQRSAAPDDADDASDDEAAALRTRERPQRAQMR